MGANPTQLDKDVQSISKYQGERRCRFDERQDAKVTTAESQNGETGSICNADSGTAHYNIKVQRQIDRLWAMPAD